MESAAEIKIAPLKKNDEDKVLESLGETVKRLRKCARVSQQELANLLGLHQTAVCRVESGMQSLQPWHLQKLSEIFDVRVTAILSGQINFWQIAERFGQRPPFPSRYLQHAHSRVRELLPLLQFATTVKGKSFVNKTLDKLGLDPVYIQGPDQPIGVDANLDLLRHLIKAGVVSTKNLHDLVNHTRSEKVQGFLDVIYRTQSGSLNLLKTLILNAHHYESNFKYEMREEKGDSLVLSIKPAEHMAEIQYKDEQLGDFLCHYKQEYLTQFPLYIGAKPAQLQESECHFHGSGQCIYTIKAA